MSNPTKEVFKVDEPPQWSLDNISKYNNFYTYNRFLRKQETNPKKDDLKRTSLDLESDEGLMDIMCDCASHIRNSPCNRLFYGAASCHNRAIITAKTKHLHPVTEVCDSYFFVLHKCMLQNKIPISNPNNKST